MTFRSSNITDTKFRRVLTAIAAVILCGMAHVAQAQADWKPSRPVKIVVPYPPGGSADILVRYIGPTMTERLGQPIVVENKPGATGSIGSGYVYSSPADGLTLLVGVSDPISIYPHLAKTPYDATKFVPVAGLGSTAFVLLGRPDLPADNLQGLLGLAKKQSLSYASAGTGSGPHMMTVAFASAAKLDNLLHVPFTGMAPALQALMGKQVDILLVAVGGATQYRSKLKFYGVSSASRVPALPDVPTLTEQGVPIVGEAWVGVLAPPNTPAATTATLSKTIGEIVSGPEFKAKVVELGMTPITGTQAEFTKYYLDEYRKWGEVVRSANIKLE